LVIDDDAFIRDTLSALFIRLGCQVFHAVDAEEGEAVARLQRPDVIISDLLMPKIPGTVMIRHLRDRGDRTPVVFLTRLEASDLAGYEDISEMGPVLHKPFDPSVLVATMKTVMSRRALLHP